MKTLKKNWLKIMIIVIVCGSLDFILQGVTSSMHLNNLSFFKPSIFAKMGLVYPVLIIYYWIVYAVLAVIFVLIQHNLPGEKWIKGFLYGLCFGGLHLIGMYEGILICNDTFINSTWVGLCDGLPILLMGTLIGIYTGTSEIQNTKRQSTLSIPVITLCFIIGRYFSYTILHINSAYNTISLETFIWTFCQGLWIGLMYFILKTGNKGKSIFSQALFFGSVIFGLNWLLYHLFIPLMFEASIVDIFIRVGVDVLFITVGAIFCYLE